MPKISFSAVLAAPRATPIMIARWAAMFGTAISHSLQALIRQEGGRKAVRAVTQGDLSEHHDHAGDQQQSGLRAVGTKGAVGGAGNEEGQQREHRGGQRIEDGMEDPLKPASFVQGSQMQAQGRRSQKRVGGAVGEGRRSGRGGWIWD